MARRGPRPNEAVQRFTALEVAVIEAVDKDAGSPCLAVSDCREPATAGHVIPENRLARLAERSGSRKMVWTLSMSGNKLLKRAAGLSPPVGCGPAGEYVSISSEYLTRRFACASHEIDLFAPIDGPDLDAANPKHRALMSYRTLLYRLRETRSRRSVFDRVRATREFGALCWETRRRQRDRAYDAVREGIWAARARSALWPELDPKSQVLSDPAFVHQRMRIEGGPRVAFAAVLWRGGQAGWTRRESADAPHLTANVREQRPFVLTCYPDEDGHVVVASCPADVAELLTVVVPAFGQGRSDRAALLSATALDSTEHIMIVPSVWHAYGDDRQHHMWQRHAAERPGPYSHSAVAPLNLFAVNA